MKNIIKIDEARTIASEIGFSDFADLRKTRTLTPLLKHAESSVKGETLSGVYLQFRPEGLYIGQAVNLTQRHQRHLDEGREIAYLAFLPVKPERLDEMEGRMIDRARELGYADRLLNVSKLPGILKLEPGFSLDDALPPARQDAWMKERLAGLFSPEGEARRIIDAAPGGHAETWKALLDLPQASRILDAAARFVSAAIPEPESLQYLYWSVGVGSARSRSARHSIFRILCGANRVFECFDFNRSQGATFVRIELASNLILPHLSELRDCAPWLALDVPAFDPPSVEELQAWEPALNRKYTSTLDRRDDLLRPLSLALLRPPVAATAALEHVETLFALPGVAPAAAAYAVGSMRKSFVRKAIHHHPIAARALLDGVCALRRDALAKPQMQ